MVKVFIDGSSGTTGLKIHDRIQSRSEVTMISVPHEYRHDIQARKEAIEAADVAFLCLPDAAAIEAVEAAADSSTVILDTSTAHRTDPRFSYGFPELGASFLKGVQTGKRIAVPGCHASGFIALIQPLVQAGLLASDSLLTCTSLTGYSGGGKGMIAAYTDENRSALLKSPRQYGISQNHKHLKEMKAITGLSVLPFFLPIVGDFYSGMEVTVPVFASQLNGSSSDIREIYQSTYTGPIVQYKESVDEEGFIASGALSGKDSMEISVSGNEERILLVARFDNLGKGASGAAVECFNIVTGAPLTEGLVL